MDEVNAELSRLIAFFPKTHFLKNRFMLFDYQSLVSDDGVHLPSIGDSLFYGSDCGAALNIESMPQSDLSMAPMTLLCFRFFLFRYL